MKELSTIFLIGIFVEKFCLLLKAFIQSITLEISRATVYFVVEFSR